MSDNKRTNGSINGKGYYIALVLCAAAIGITGYLYYQNTKEEVNLQETLPDIVVGTMEAEENVPAVATEPQVEVILPTETVVPKPTAGKKLQTTAPVAGEEISGYSMEALSYNQTTRDWRVHNGVDYAAAEGTQVVAAADGQVYSVHEDDAMGCTVVIRHEGGYTTQYASLSKEIPVKPGDQVTMGQCIGYVGSTALVETTYGSHVHFSVTYQNQIMNPAEFLQVG